MKVRELLEDTGPLTESTEEALENGDVVLAGAKENAEAIPALLDAYWAKVKGACSSEERVWKLRGALGSLGAVEAHLQNVKRGLERGIAGDGGGFSLSRREE